ncbi:kinesin light chain [Apiospora sp. TS-2023a]
MDRYEQSPGLSSAETFAMSISSTVVYNEYIGAEVRATLDALAYTAEDILRCLDDIRSYNSERPPMSYFTLQELFRGLLEICHGLQNRVAGEVPWTSSRHGNLSDMLWTSVRKVADRCLNETSGPLHTGLQDILHTKPILGSTLSAKVPVLKQFLDLLATYEHIVQDISPQIEVLSMLQTAISLSSFRGVMSSDKGSLLEAHKVAHHLRAKISRLGYIRDQTELISLDAEKEEAVQHAQQMYQAWRAMSRNRHFPDRAHANDYVGHKEQLMDIEDALDQATSASPIQKRFVIQGQPGSGKTELALRYAIEHKAYYWGCFGSMLEFGENLTEQAAKQFLSSREPIHPWLLMIDNADDHDIDLEELSPKGDRGSILATTRNPEKSDYGNAGRRFLTLEKMNNDDANELLLKAAEEPRRTESILGYASRICEHLYYLPLALVHAGKAIHHHGLGLSQYIDYFDKEAGRIREAWSRLRGRKIVSSGGQGKQGDPDGYEHMSVYATFELMLRQLEDTATDKDTVSDALQLLQIFSFMHFDNIRFDMLLNASFHPLREKEEQDRLQARENEIVNRLGLQTEPVQPYLKSSISKLAARCFLPALLPDMLKSPSSFDILDLKGKVSKRLRNALKILVSRSLVNKITSGEGYDFTPVSANRPLVERYKMHPLVHKWMRDRPSLRVSEQALYCQMASGVLTSCIILIGGDGEEDMTLRREMKPHIEEVRTCLKTIQAQISDRKSKRDQNAWSITAWLKWRLFSWPETWFWPWYGQVKLGEKARFGKVYLECGDFEEAGNLLSEVHDHLIRRFGPDNHLTHLAKSGLAVAFINQTRRNDSEKLLSEVHESKERLYGPSHPRTLEAAVQHAEGVLAQGKGLREAFGEYDKKTIKCVTLIGKIYSHKFEYSESVRWLRKALESAMEVSPGNEIDTLSYTEILDIKEDLAMSLTNACSGIQDLKIREKNLSEAEDLIQHVVNRRKEIWSESHPFTLLGKGYQGRIIAARGRLEEAERLMKNALETALLVLGGEHLGLLAGKKWYADVLVQRGKLEEAERYLREASDQEKYQKAAGSDGEHPDRILHLWSLVLCLEKQGKLTEALDLCRQLKHNIPLIGGHGLGARHVFNNDLDEKLDYLEARLGKT